MKTQKQFTPQNLINNKIISKNDFIAWFDGVGDQLESTTKNIQESTGLKSPSVNISDEDADANFDNVFNSFFCESSEI